MFFFSGVVFPVANLPAYLRPVAEIFPLTHSVRIVREVARGRLTTLSAIDVGAILLFTLVAGFFPSEGSRRRLIQ